MLFTSAAEAVVAAFCIFEAVHYFKIRRDDGKQDELCDLLSLLYNIASATVVEQLDLNSTGKARVYHTVGCKRVIDHQTRLALDHAYIALRDSDVYTGVKGSATIGRDNLILSRIEIESGIGKIAELIASATDTSDEIARNLGQMA